MLELTLEQITNPAFQKAVVAVNNATNLDAKTVYRAGRICQVCYKEAEKAKLVMKELAQKHYFNLTEDRFATPEDQEAYMAELNKTLSETKIQIKVMPLDWNEIFNNVKLTGLELVHLEPVCVNVPVELGE